MSACNLNNPASFNSNVSGQAILIGEAIQLLDSDLAHSKKVTMLKEGTLVSLLAISDSLFRPTQDFCDAFNYVQIVTKSDTGFVDGRNVYKIEDSNQDTSFSYRNTIYNLKTTSFFGIGVTYDDGLSFCSKYNQPAIIVNNSNSETSLIKMIKNDLYAEASLNSDFDFFELRADAGALDKIKSIKSFEDGVVLTIKREFQEAWNEYEVKLILYKNEYSAEYLSYGKLNY
ncbi:MAG: hypothetical protein HRT71_13410 [Flavobacteriales bacterium]|nr:hypothetical protein [Flavobacteriales bacterium]